MQDYWLETGEHGLIQSILGRQSSRNLEEFELHLGMGFNPHGLGKFVRGIDIVEDVLAHKSGKYVVIGKPDSPSSLVTSGSRLYLIF